MKPLITSLLLLLFFTHASSQVTNKKPDWYSASNTSGIVIQNSYPRGGPYTGPGRKYHNYSRLVFFSRVVNETSAPVELNITFSADSIPIPGSPDTFMKLFLPSDTMTYDKRFVFDYGVKHLETLDKPTAFKRTLKPKEEFLMYVVAIFYQTTATAQNQDRGGNRAELVMQGEKLFYRIPPQLKSLPCGEIIFK